MNDTIATGPTERLQRHPFRGLEYPTPPAVLIYAQSPYATGGGRVSYTGSADTTISGSRSGHTPLILWTALTRLGTEGLRARAAASRELAVHTHKELRKLSWPTTLNPHAFTVALQTPPAAVRAKWVLADDGQRAHIVCMPGITKPQITDFLSDLKAAVTPTRRVPRPRSRQLATSTATV